ncbi:MAG: choice-of-anchor Q domain-containing protein [Solirubrobacteraceae bacterium]
MQLTLRWRRIGPVVRWQLAAAVVAVIALAPAGLARAATTWQVTSQHDGAGSCAGSSCTTLRAAVAAASAGDTVMLPASTKHYILTQGEIQITKPIRIMGAGPRSSVVDARGHSRVFEVTIGVTHSQTVTFRALTITGGKVTSLTAAAPGGGGVVVDSNAGNLMLNHVLVSGNSVSGVSSNGNGTRLAGGGGILDLGGSFVGPSFTEVGGNLTLLRSTVSDNHVTLQGDGDAPGGGGIKVDEGNTTLTRSVVSGNTVDTSAATGDDQGGGGIENRGRILTLNASTIRGNTITTSATSPRGSGGGGINNQGDIMRVTRSTISGNTANIAVNHDAGGGGVFDGEGSVWVNSTVAGNTTNVPAGLRTGGGGIYSPAFEATRFTNVTIVRNSSAHAPGGGIFAPAGEGGKLVRIKNSIVALNHSGAGGVNCGGRQKTFRSLGHNLEDDRGRSCRFTKASDIFSAHPLLGPLASNGGPTKTVALLTGSPAIDRIPLASCTDQSSVRVTIDQRGRSRPDGHEPRCDVGAYESRG